MALVLFCSNKMCDAGSTDLSTAVFRPALKRTQWQGLECKGNWAAQTAPLLVLFSFVTGFDSLSSQTQLKSICTWTQQGSQTHSCTKKSVHHEQTWELVCMQVKESVLLFSTSFPQQSPVRMQCVRALQGLYQEKEFIGRLELFTSRFKVRHPSGLGSHLV